MRLGYRAIFLGLFLTVLFSVSSIYLEMIVSNNFTVTDTLIPVLTYFFLIVLLLVINPILKIIYKNILEIRLFRPFNRHEILLVTIMTLVTSGISGYGLMNLLVPFIGTVNAPSRSTSQSDWGLLSQTVLKYKDVTNKDLIYGDVESENEKEITLRIYNGKNKDQDDLKVFQKSDFDIQRPLVNPKLVLNRNDSDIFEKGLPEMELVDEVTKKTYYKAQNSFPALVPFPKETPSAWKERITKYYKDGKIQEGYSFWGSVPWHAIVPPFCYWLIFVLLLYLSLFSLAKILFTQWAKYERLQFPLATIPQELLGETNQDPESKIYPTFSIWRNVFFIVGFVLALSCILLSAFPPYMPLALTAKEFVSGTIFEGLKDSSIEFHVFFILIGIAFMVPKEISFSVWFFGLIFVAQILFAIWFGFGKSAASFQTDYYTKINFYTAQSFGGLIIFSGFALWNVRHYLLAGLYKVLKIKPKSVSTEIVEENSLASKLFIVSAIGIFCFMIWMNISFWWACIYCFITLMFIIASMRVASECGIIGYQNLTGGGGHFIGNVIGIKNIGIGSFVNVMVLHMIFFFDTRLFLGPNVMVAQKVEDENQVQRKRFWLVLFGGVVLTVIVSFLYMVMLVYHQGSKSLEPWYYVQVPNGVYGQSVQMIKSTVTEPMINISQPMTFFIIFGMACMATLLFARTKWFWVPHPVGILLWVSESETKYFMFCFFLGWLIKFIVVKLGTKETIENMKKWAIGLIFGHILGVMIIGIIKMFITLTAKATLNFH